MKIKWYEVTLGSAITLHDTRGKALKFYRGQWDRHGSGQVMEFVAESATGAADIVRAIRTPDEIGGVVSGVCLAQYRRSEDGRIIETVTRTAKVRK